MFKKTNDEKKAFEILMHENSAMLLTYIRSVAGSKHAVEDIFQETMITAWKKLGEFDRDKVFGAWLRGIAKNHALNYYRKSKRDMLMCNSEILDYVDDQVHHIDSLNGDTWDEKTEALHRCIEELPSIYQQVIRLRYLEEMKTSQVNNEIDISKENLKKRLQRAKQKLLDCMKAKFALLQSAGFI